MWAVQLLLLVLGYFKLTAFFTEIKIFWIFLTLLKWLKPWTCKLCLRQAALQTYLSLNFNYIFFFQFNLVIYALDISAWPKPVMIYVNKTSGMPDFLKMQTPIYFKDNALYTLLQGLALTTQV